MAAIAAPVSSSVFPAGLIVSASVVGKSAASALLAQARMQHETISNAVLGGDVERSQGDSGPLDETPASISPRRGLKEPPPPSPPPQLHHMASGDESPVGNGAARERDGAGVGSLAKRHPPQLQPKNAGSPVEGPPPVPAHRRGYASRYVASRDGSGGSTRGSASPPPRHSATTESATAAAWSATSAASRPIAIPVARQPVQRPARRPAPSVVAGTYASERGEHGDATAAGQQQGGGGGGGGSATRARSLRRRAAPASASAEDTSRLVDSRAWNSSTVVVRGGGHRRRGGDEAAPESSPPRRPGGVRSASRPAPAGYVSESEPTASALRSGASSSAPKAATAAVVTAAEPPSPPVAPIRVWGGAGGSRTPGSLSARRLASAAATEPVPLPTPPPPVPPSPEALRAAAEAAEAAELASLREEKARVAALLSAARAKVCMRCRGPRGCPGQARALALCFSAGGRGGS